MTLAALVQEAHVEQTVLFASFLTAQDASLKALRASDSSEHGEKTEVWTSLLLMLNYYRCVCVCVCVCVCKYYILFT